MATKKQTRRNGVLDYAKSHITRRVPYYNTVYRPIEFARKRVYETRQMDTYRRRDKPYVDQYREKLFTKRNLKRKVRRAVLYGLGQTVPGHRELRKISREYRRIKCMTAKDNRRHEYFKNKASGGSRSKTKYRRHKKCL